MRHKMISQPQPAADELGQWPQSEMFYDSTVLLCVTAGTLLVNLHHCFHSRFAKWAAAYLIPQHQVA